MKRTITIFPLACALCIAWVMMGCKADVDLDNIDTTTSVKANLALPVGSISATIGDFVGDGAWGIFVDSVNNRGVLTFKDTFTWVRPFHDVDLSQYLSKQTLKMNVYDKLKDLPFFIDGKITGSDNYTIPLEFPLTLHLNGINHDEDNERLDRALINNASFVSTISRSNLPLEWEWIEKVTIKLGDAFERPAGNIVTVYEKGVSDSYGYDQDIPINVDEFSMNLMKNKNPSKWEDYRGNVVDTCNFLITMYIKIPSSAGQVHVPADASFQYHLGVRFIDYSAIWGMFKPSSDMSDENVIDIAEEWEGYKTLKKLSLPLAEPSIDMSITTKIAGAMILHGDYLYVEGINGEKINATFDGKHELYKYFTPSEYLPLDSEIGDSVTMHVLFDKDPMRGHIDNFFTIHPEKVGYKYTLDFNRQETPQLRITENTGVRLDAECTLPFIFNEGVSLGYADTITDIDLSQITLDSLLAEVQIIDTIEEATLKLGLSIENSIPLQFYGVLTCLDSVGNVLMNPEDATKPFRITGQDTLIIASPNYTEDANGSWIGTPNKVTNVITITEDVLTTVSKIKSIVFNVWLDDKSLQQAYDDGMVNIRLTDKQGLRIGIGVGADLKAILDLNSLFDQSDDSLNNQPQ